MSSTIAQTRLTPDDLLAMPDALLEGEYVLPGFSCRLGDLFLPAGEGEN